MSIITKSCHVPTPRQRLAAHRDRIERLIEAQSTEVLSNVCEVVVKHEDKPAKPAPANVISACLRRKGGAK